MKCEWGGRAQGPGKRAGKRTTLVVVAITQIVRCDGRGISRLYLVDLSLSVGHALFLRNGCCSERGYIATSASNTTRPTVTVTTTSDDVDAPLAGHEVVAGGPAVALGLGVVITVGGGGVEGATVAGGSDGTAVDGVTGVAVVVAGTADVGTAVADPTVGTTLVTVGGGVWAAGGAVVVGAMVVVDAVAEGSVGSVSPNVSADISTPSGHHSISYDASFRPSASGVRHVKVAVMSSYGYV